MESPRRDESIHGHGVVKIEPKKDSIFENKAQYLRNKRKTEIEGLEAELSKHKQKLRALEETIGPDLERLKERQQKELDQVEQSYKETMDLIGSEKEKILGSLHDVIERERSKMEQMHSAELDQKERMFE